MYNPLRLAVLIPCYNEEVAIGTVVRDFQRVLPQATIYVFDNNSRDRTVDIARSHGAVVRHVPLQGKGNVMRRMFADIEADIYILVDGDDTYHAQSSPQMIDTLLAEGLDMVVGRRKSTEVESYRLGHRLGNRMLTGFVAQLFGRRFTDMLSGYRVFSRRYVKSFPALARGFETETELTVHALELRMPVTEVDTPYKARPEGSFSKLNTIRDGIRILNTILRLFRLERPLLFFGLISLLLALLAIGLATPPGTHLHRNRPRPAPAHRPAGHRPGHPLQPLTHLRPHPRKRHANPARSPPADLPRHPLHRQHIPLGRPARRENRLTARLLRFGLVGTAGYLVDAGLLQTMVQWGGINPFLARLGSFIAAATATWWLNRTYTFSARHQASGGEWLRYITAMTLGGLINYGAFAAALLWLPHPLRQPWLAVACGSLAGMAANYYTSSRFIFVR